MLLARTTRFSRGRLPHWEVEQGRYFVTVRCHDSLPAEVIQRLREVHATLQQTTAQSPEFAQLQRQYFRTMEKYLHRGTGESPLTNPSAAQALTSCFDALEARGIRAVHYTIMPNHWHALLAPTPDASIDLHRTMCWLKGASARTVNAALQRTGPLWQREWFDRWIRSDAEWEKCRDYIRANPVKARLAQHWSEHRWTR